MLQPDPAGAPAGGVGPGATNHRRASVNRMPAKAVFGDEEITIGAGGQRGAGGGIPTIGLLPADVLFRARRKGAIAS